MNFMKLCPNQYIISSQIGVDAYKNLIFNIRLLCLSWSIANWKMVEVDFLFKIKC